MLYAVLIDTGCDWPDVIFVGTRDEAEKFNRRISAEYYTSIQAVVSLDEALNAERFYRAAHLK